MTKFKTPAKLVLFWSILTSTLLYAQPRIDSIFPKIGKYGDTISIFGSGFSSTPGENIVHFGHAPAGILSSGDKFIEVKVPVGAIFGELTVKTPMGRSMISPGFLPTFNGTRNKIPPTFDSIFITTPDFLYKIEIADIDQDGKPDLIGVSNVAAKLYVFRNTSTNYNISFAQPTINYLSGSGQCVGIGDFNNDGKPDIAVGTSYPNQLQIYVNQSNKGSINLAPNVLIYTNSEPIDIAIGDINKDGKNDLVVADNQYGIDIIRNHSAGNFIQFSLTNLLTPVGPYPSGSTQGVLLHDYNGDGLLDIMATAYTSLSDSFHLYRNLSTVNNINFQKELISAKKGRGTIGGFTIGDFNNDDLIDMAAANWLRTTRTPNSTVSIATKKGKESVVFSTGDSIVTGVHPLSIAAHDFNGDGNLDIVTGNTISNSVSLLINNGRPASTSFSPVVNYGIGGQPRFVAAADMDADGKPDVVMGSLLLQRIAILRNISPERVDFCGIGNQKLFSKRVGSAYQWQISEDGVNFTNIIDGASYTGTDRDTLTINNMTTDFDGRFFRCKVDSNNGIPQEISIVNSFTGAQNLLWHNPMNWSCGIVPDQNTSVTILTNCDIDMDAACKRLLLKNNAIVNVNPGVILSIVE